MSIDPVLPITGATDSAIKVAAAAYRRLEVAGTMAHDAHAIAARPGVVAGLTASMSGLTVTIQPGSAVVTPMVTSNGSYRASIASAVARTLTARDATYSRRDLVVLRVRDGEADSSGQYVADIEVVPGAPGASPSVPAAPSGSLPLWIATVPPSGTVTLVDQRAWASSLGAVITCTSTTRPSGVALRAGQHIYEVDTQAVRVWTGSAWQLVAEPQREWVMVSTTARPYYPPTAYATQESVDLVVANLPAGTYAYDGDIIAQSGGSDLVITWQGHTSFSGSVMSESVGANADEGTGRFISVTGAVAATLTGGASPNGAPVHISGLITTAGGKVGLMFGRTSITYQVQVLPGSRLRLTRV